MVLLDSRQRNLQLKLKVNDQDMLLYQEDPKTLVGVLELEESYNIMETYLHTLPISYTLLLAARRV
jgi:hypothetical protein